ncbi:MAG: PorT family protein [Bacteroidia bacterium]|nr:PorT family protein [Bacteroidia bacterium]
MIRSIIRLAVLLPIFIGFLKPALAQNNIHYDLRQFNLGFLMGLNIADVKIKYNHLSTNYDKAGDLSEIDALSSPGITLGMITNTKLLPNFDFRFIPSISLQQRNFNYHFASHKKISYFQYQDSMVKKRLESANLDLPAMIRFRSNFYKNYRVYVMSGIKYSINLASDKRSRDDPNVIKIDKRDWSWEVAAGIEIYGDRVKLTPEIRYSLGLRNVYAPENTDFGDRISRMNTQAILISLNFE